MLITITSYSIIRVFSMNELLPPLVYKFLFRCFTLKQSLSFPHFRFFSISDKDQNFFFSVFLITFLIFLNIEILSFHKNPLNILANIHPYRIVLILILSYPRILCFYINRGIKGSGKFSFFFFFLVHFRENGLG